MVTVLGCDEGLQTVSLKMWGAYWDCHTKERLKLEVSEKKVSEGRDLEIRCSPKERQIAPAVWVRDESSCLLASQGISWYGMNGIAHQSRIHIWLKLVKILVCVGLARTSGCGGHLAGRATRAACLRNEVRSTDPKALVVMPYQTQSILLALNL